jgi:hypothetical protein
MISLDEQQDRVLRDLAAAIGKATEERELRRLRRMAVLMLSLSRWWNPRKFDEWNSERIGEYRNQTCVVSPMTAVARQNTRHCQRPGPRRPAAATSPAPALNLEARSMQEIVEAIRIWRDERGITLETLDYIAGWPADMAPNCSVPSREKTWDGSVWAWD